MRQNLGYASAVGGALRSKAGIMPTATGAPLIEEKTNLAKRKTRMLMIEFELDVKPFSVNQMTYRDARFKTAEYKAWAEMVLAQLSEMDQHKELMAIAADHARLGGVFHVEFTYEYPPHVFYNKSKQVSAKTIDCSNGAKPLLDLIFGDTMKVNDRFVTKLTERKCVGARTRILVKLEFVPQPG